jgi:hypothetical protein
MVVRSAQKGQDDIQRIRVAMENGKPVITEFQQELIIKHANILGEYGRAMIHDIEDAALQPNQMAGDVFKLIESCMASLSQKVKRRMLSDEVTRQKEPESLTQVEAIREQATMLHGSRLSGDRLSEESVRKTMRRLVDEYMAAVDQDKEDGLEPDTARLWKEQVHEITTQAKLDQPAVSVGWSEPGPAPHSEAMDCLAPLKSPSSRHTTPRLPWQES